MAEQLQIRWHRGGDADPMACEMRERIQWRVTVLFQTTQANREIIWTTYED